MTPKTMTSRTSKRRASRAPSRIWSTRRPARSWALMTCRYFGVLRVHTARAEVIRSRWAFISFLKVGSKDRKP